MITLRAIGSRGGHGGAPRRHCHRSRLARAAGLLLSVAFLALGTALAQPEVQLGSFSMGTGNVTSYLQQRARAAARRGGGTVLQAGAGACYQRTAGAAAPGFACFLQALRTSGVALEPSGGGPVTVFAPTDAAFAHLEDTIGLRAFLDFTRSPRAMTRLVQRSLVPGSYLLSDMANRASPARPVTVLTTATGAPLTVAFGRLGFGTSTTTVEVGPADALDGQSYVSGTPVRFPNGSVVIPLGRVPLRSLWGG